jgi:ABC-type amino acid transport substrate-binding protein
MTTDGGWVGFNVDVCRAVAVAALGEANRIEIVPLTTQVRFQALASGTGAIMAPARRLRDQAGEGSGKSAGADGARAAGSGSACTTRRRWVVRVRAT